MVFGLWRKTPAADVRRLPEADAQDIDMGALLAPAHDLAQMLYAAYTDEDNRLHAETVIGAAAALTGEFALRATGVPLPPGGFVLGDPVNEILYEGEAQNQLTLWTVLSLAPLAQRDLPNPHDIFRRIAEAIADIMGGRGSDNFPPLSVSPDNYPHEWSPNAGPRLREHVAAIGNRHELSPRQLAFALCLAIVGMIKEMKDVLAPATAVTLAAEIMFATAKMAPVKTTIN